jgi:2-methylisocitrate lyase-like PEP mutase family enzyme
MMKSCPHWPDCGCGTQSGPHTCEWKEAIEEIQAVVDEQAEDEGLWFIARTITEDILQRALRRLHEVIERKTPCC